MYISWCVIKHLGRMAVESSMNKETKVKWKKQIEGI